MREAARALPGQATTYAIQFILLILVARMLGPSDQGQYSLLRAAVYLSEVFLWLGLNTGLTYLVARDPARYQGPLIQASILYLGFALMVAAVLLLVVRPHTSPGGVMEVLVARPMLFLGWLATLALLGVIQRTFLGLREFGLYNQTFIISAAASLVVVTTLAIMGRVTVGAVARASVAGNLAGLIFGVWIHRSRLAKLGPFRWDRALLPVLGEAYTVGLKGYASSIAFFALYRLDFFFVGHFLGNRSLGLYAVAVQVVEAIQKIPDWLATVVAPQIAAGRPGGAQLTRRLAATSVGAVVAFGLVALLLQPWEAAYLPYVLGAEYVGVGGLVVLLVPRAVLHAIMVSYAGYLAGRGYTLFHPLAGLAGVVVLCGMDVLFIPTHGVSGALAGITAAYVAATVVMVIGFRNEMRVGAGPK
jgi:O-antigen/teichoic acid export membrane protein